MASDASSGDGRPVDSKRSLAPIRDADEAQRRTTAELTHELAQLLAATIAQRQLANGLPAATSGSLNLAGLPSSQRTLEPAFKDGLSALSYKQPRGTSLVPADDLPPDDEPMPIPSTWREPARPEGDRWLRQQMGATLLGLCAGLLVVVPVVLWFSGWVGTSPKAKSGRSTEATIAPIDPKTSEVQTVKVQVRPFDRTSQTASQYVTGSIDPRLSAEPSRQIEQVPPVPLVKAPEPVAKPEAPRSRIDDELAEARQRIESGDIAGAREVLATAGSNTPGPAAFALAETYDPNMLAAWGTRGATADVPKARALYRKSLALGVTRAQLRLDALQ